MGKVLLKTRMGRTKYNIDTEKETPVYCPRLRYNSYKFFSLSSVRDDVTGDRLKNY